MGEILLLKKKKEKKKLEVKVGEKLTTKEQHKGIIGVRKLFGI